MPTGRRRTEGPHYRSGRRLGGVGLRFKPPWHHGGHGVVDIVGPVAPPGRASGRGDSQECTQIAENGLSAPFWGICVHCCASRGSCEQPWGRRSVHRSVETAPRRRFGAFVYTVATRVAIRIATRAAPGGTSASTTMACRLRLLAGPSRLVGKTNSERAAPLPGWHLRQGVNPREPLKSQKWDFFKAERTVAPTLAHLHEHMEFHRFNPNATGICIFLCHDQVPVQ